ncbi:hypothetical protein DPMN_182887 [Dreissena polymorpha]|uniref:Uncharacterized protein n=1 Tax=Dreissena polymorpha TaxID=45954 RepID=A0A9D4DGK1_DREPO|nr:hypothetical protein DPMN_182887 [Dreissena polymorpha]
MQPADQEPLSEHLLPEATSALHCVPPYPCLQPLIQVPSLLVIIPSQWREQGMLHKGP